MIRLTPDEVKERFGQFFYELFLTLVDSSKHLVEIVEIFGIYPGSAEWTAINRCRAGGIIESYELYGKTAIIHARIGEADVHFGPADREQGGQALQAALVEGDRVRTKWIGIAGMSLSTCGSLPQAPGVIEAWYPSEDDLNVGGSKTGRVEIITPLYEKVSFGIDDTDDPEGGATFALIMNARNQVSKIEGVHPLLVKFAQLFPKCPYKTTNCTSSFISFAVRPDAKKDLINGIVDFILSKTRSEDTGIAFIEGMGIPRDLNRFGWEAKKRLISLDEAYALEGIGGLQIIDTGRGKKGVIGALAALGLSEEKYAAALEDDAGLKRITRW
ncbi:MAG: tRNA(Ile2) 2-agmatinylcytidine synthetase [Syntrophorhabdaceae bacterium]